MRRVVSVIMKAEYIGLGLGDDSRDIKDVGQIPLTWCLLSALLGYLNREFSFGVLPALALFDSCCEKITLFGVENRGSLILVLQYDYLVNIKACMYTQAVQLTE